MTYGQSLTINGDTHAACRAFNHALSTLNIDDVEVFHFDFSDFAQLVRG